MSLEDIFSAEDVQWSRDVGTNSICLKDEKGAVVVIRGLRRCEDFALNCAALDYVLEAEAAGRIKEGYVVLGQRTGIKLEFVACERAEVVRRRLEGIERHAGDYGQYWRINKEFRSILPSGGVVPADAPF